jgi:acyl dehydratase
MLVYEFPLMFYFNFKVGDRFISRSRIVTPTDVDLFAGVTGAVNPLFLNEEARRRGFEGRITLDVLRSGLLKEWGDGKIILSNFIEEDCLNN